MKGQVFVKCKSNYGRLSRKLNQVAFLDIHMGIIFYRPKHMFFFEGVLAKKQTTYLVIKT